jgi:TolA-binding protein
MRKDERHQIKRDELVTLIERTSDWVALNRRLIGLAAAGLALALVAALGARSFMASRSAAASFLVGEMIQTHRAPVTASLEDLPEAGGVRTYGTVEERDARVLEIAESILARYGRTSSAPKARYYKGLALAGLRRDDEARAAFEDFLRRHPRDFLAPWARHHLGRMLEAGGRPGEALIHYQALADDARGIFPREEGLLGVARCQEALGQKEEALKVYRRIVADFPDSDYQFEARRKVEELG